MQPNFFTEHSPYLNHPLLTAERTSREVDFVLATMGLASDASILDVGCGFGRHSIELAQRGFSVTGFDPSAAMIAAAREAAKDAAVGVDFRVAGGVDFHAGKLFDAAICLFTTLGQISEGVEDNRELLAMIFQSLKQDGQLLIEVPDHDKFVTKLKPHDRFGDDVIYTDVVREFDSAENIVTERFTIVTPETTRNFLLRYRLFSATDLAILLRTAGFAMRGCWSDYKSNSVKAAGTMQIVHAVKMRNPDNVSDF